MFPIADARTPGDEVSHELKRTMIEIGTPVCSSLGEVRAHLERLRGEVASAAATCGLAIIAAGTHPITATLDDDLTDEPDYVDLADRYARLAYEQNVCGCHVHVGITDREVAIAASNFVRPWLSVLLAVSASSPFWNGADTGYDSYRTEIFGRWPTAGPPEAFRDRADYDDVVEQLLATGTIDSPSRIYWDARPSVRYETLEVRVADVCTSLDDAVLLAGLTGALVRTGVAAALAGEELADRPSRAAPGRPLAGRALRPVGRPRRRPRTPQPTGDGPPRPPARRHRPAARALGRARRRHVAARHRRRARHELAAPAGRLRRARLDHRRGRLARPRDRRPRSVRSTGLTSSDRYGEPSHASSLRTTTVKILRRALFALWLAGVIAGAMRVRGRGGVPPQHGGWQPIDVGEG